MNQIPKNLLLAIATALTTGCCVFAYTQAFTFEVAAAQRDGVRINPNEGEVHFQWNVLPNDLKVVIENRTKNPIIIQWPSAIFIDFVGSSHGFRPLTESQVLEAGRKSVQVIYPKDFEHTFPNSRISFRVSFWPRNWVDRSAAEEFGKAHIGDEAKIILPVIVNGVTHTYAFSIRTTAFTLNRKCVT